MSTFSIFSCVSFSHQSVYISGFGYISICNYFSSKSCLHRCLMQLEAEHIKQCGLASPLQGVLNNHFS